MNGAYCLCNAVVNRLDYTVRNTGIIIEQRVGKNVHGSGSGQIWDTVPESVEELGKITKTCQGSR